MDLPDFDSVGGEGLRGEGPEADVVMSSRVRLARNLAGFSFATRATEEQRQEIVGRARTAAEGLALGRRRYFVELSALEDRREAKERELDRALLHERHLISNLRTTAKWSSSSRSRTSRTRPSFWTSRRTCGRSATSCLATTGGMSSGNSATDSTFVEGPDKEKSTFDQLLFHIRLPARGADPKAEKIVHKLHLLIKNEW